MKGNKRKLVQVRNQYDKKPPKAPVDKRKTAVGGRRARAFVKRRA